MNLDSIIERVREKITADDKAVFIIVLLFLITALARLLFGLVPWYFLILMVPLFFVTLLRPKAGLMAIVLLTVLFERFFTLEAFQFGRDVLKLYPLDIILLGVYGGMIAKIFFGKIRYTWKPADIFFILFFLLATAYFIASFVGFGSDNMAVAFSTWKNYVFYGMLFFALPILCDSEADVRRLVRYFLVAATFGIVFIVIGAARGEGLWTEFTPLSTAGVRLLAFPHAFYFSLAFLGMFVSAGYWSTNKYRFFIWLVMALWMFGILGSLMRHLWIGMALSFVCAFVFLMDERGRQAARTMGVIALAFATTLFSLWLFLSFLFPTSTVGEAFQASSQVVAGRVISIGNAADTSISWRGSTWQSAFMELSKNPLLGTGFGMRIPVESGEYRDFIEIRNIHNSWLALLVQMGLLGFLIFVSSLIALARRVFYLIFDSGAKFLSAVRIVSLTLFLYQSIVLLAQPYLETNLMGIFFWMTLGLMNTLPALSRKSIENQTV
ncbi:MAG: O-antigen ligase family protein [Candidatus Moranbacteria bacterium]|nr:O-antigen ligase family protein [Candidatus Moranbacteria bacterium]